MGKKSTVLRGRVQPPGGICKLCIYVSSLFGHIHINSKKGNFFLPEILLSSKNPNKGKIINVNYNISQVYRILLDSTNIEASYIRE